MELAGLEPSCCLWQRPAISAGNVAGEPVGSEPSGVALLMQPPVRRKELQTLSCNSNLVDRLIVTESTLSIRNLNDPRTLELFSRLMYQAFWPVPGSVHAIGPDERIIRPAIEPYVAHCLLHLEDVKQVLASSLNHWSGEGLHRLGPASYKEGGSTEGL
jgi:hypothetical protein